VSPASKEVCDKYVSAGTFDLDAGYFSDPVYVIGSAPLRDFFDGHGVQPGSYVRATWCEGNHFCTPKKEEKKEQPAPHHSKKEANQNHLFDGISQGSRGSRSSQIARRSQRRWWGLRQQWLKSV